MDQSVMVGSIFLVALLAGFAADADLHRRPRPIISKQPASTGHSPVELNHLDELVAAFDGVILW